MVAALALTSHEYLNVSTDYETQPRNSSVSALSSTQSPQTSLVEDSFNMDEASRKQQEIENLDPYKFDGSPRSDATHHRQSAGRKRKRDEKAPRTANKKPKTVGKLTSAKHAQTSVSKSASKGIQNVARTIPPQSSTTDKRPHPVFNSIGPNSITYESRRETFPQQKQKKDAPIVDDRRPKADAVIKFGPGGVQSKDQKAHGGTSVGQGESPRQDKAGRQTKPLPAPGLDVTNVAQSQEDILAGFERPAATAAPAFKSPAVTTFKEHDFSTTSTESKVSTIVDTSVDYDTATHPIPKPQQIMLPPSSLHGNKSNKSEGQPKMSDGTKPYSKSVKLQKNQKKPAKSKASSRGMGEQKIDEQGQAVIEKRASKLPIGDSGYYSNNHALIDKTREPGSIVVAAKRDNALQPARRISEKGSPLLGDATYCNDAELASLVDEDSLSNGRTPSRMIFETREVHPTVEIYAEPIDQQKLASKQPAIPMTVPEPIGGHVGDTDDLDIDDMLDWRESLASHQRFMFDTFVKDARGLVDVLVAREVEVQTLIEDYRSRGRAIYKAVQVHEGDIEHNKHHGG